VALETPVPPGIFHFRANTPFAQIARANSQFAPASATEKACWQNLRSASWTEFCRGFLKVRRLSRNPGRDKSFRGLRDFRRVRRGLETFFLHYGLRFCALLSPVNTVCGILQPAGSSGFLFCLSSGNKGFLRFLEPDNSEGKPAEE